MTTFQRFLPYDFPGEERNEVFKGSLEIVTLFEAY